MFEAVAVRATLPNGGCITVTAIEKLKIVKVYVYGFGPIDAAWLRSSQGIHRAELPPPRLYVSPPLPPPPEPVALVLVSAGTAVEVDLR